MFYRVLPQSFLDAFFFSVCIGFSSNERQGGELFAELFRVYHGLMLVINNYIQRVICETDSFEVLCLLQNSYHSHMHVYASLLANIFGLKEHIPNISFKHVLREEHTPSPAFKIMDNTCVTLWCQLYATFTCMSPFS